MGKAIIFVILGALTQIALMLFGGTTNDISLSSNSTAYEGNSTASITKIITNPDSWYQNPLWTFLTQGFGLFAVAAALMVGAFFFRNERVLFIGIAATFLSFVIPLINLWQFLSSQGIGGAASGFLIALFIGPLVVIAIGTIIDFAQGKD